MFIKLFLQLSTMSARMLDTLERFRKENMQLAKVSIADFNTDVCMYIFA